MKTIEEQIKVMQHFANGGEIEIKSTTANKGWHIIKAPSFNWGTNDYRIKEKKQTVTIEKWLMEGSSKGSFYTMESNAEFSKGWDNKIKLLDTYEVEL